LKQIGREANVMIQHCDLCGTDFSGRSFKRRGHLAKNFCSIACVEAFEVRVGLPAGRIYESRPGWSSFPMVQALPVAQAC